MISACDGAPAFTPCLGGVQPKLLDATFCMHARHSATWELHRHNIECTLMDFALARFESRAKGEPVFTV